MLMGHGSYARLSPAVRVAAVREVFVVIVVVGATFFGIISVAKAVIRAERELALRRRSRWE